MTVTSCNEPNTHSAKLANYTYQRTTMHLAGAAAVRRWSNLPGRSRRGERRSLARSNGPGGRECLFLTQCTTRLPLGFPQRDIDRPDGAADHYRAFGHDGTISRTLGQRAVTTV